MIYDELVSLCEEYGYLRAGPESDLERWLSRQLCRAEGFDKTYPCGSFDLDDDAEADGVEPQPELVATLVAEIADLKAERDRNTQRIKDLEERQNQAVAIIRGVASAETKQEAGDALDRLRRTRRNRPRASD